MNWPLIGFLAAGAYVFREHLRTQLPFWRARRRWERILEDRGVSWSHADLHRALTSEPESIYRADDDSELRGIKADLIRGMEGIHGDRGRLLRIVFLAPIAGIIAFTLLGAVLERL